FSHDLRGRSASHLQQTVIPAPRVIVRPARRTMAPRIPREIQTLALVTPPPVILVRLQRQPEHHCVITAPGMIVRAARRTMAARIAAEVHSLALVTPAPVALSRRRARV